MLAVCKRASVSPEVVQTEDRGCAQEEACLLVKADVGERTCQRSGLPPEVSTPFL